MYTFLNKYGQVLAFGLGVLITVIFLVSIFSAPEPEMESWLSESAGPEKYDTNAFDFGLFSSLGLTALAFIVAVIFGITQLASNPKGSIKGLIGLAVLVIIAFVAYSSANGDLAQEAPEIQRSIEKFETDQATTFDSGTLKLVSGSIITALIMIGLSIASLILFGIYSTFK